MKFLKLFYISPLIFAVLVTNMALGQSRTAEKTWLFAIQTEDKSEKFVGVMVNEVTCRAISIAMNEWAKLPPVTPLHFFCGAEPQKA